MFLLQSCTISPARLYSQFGPNMTLALELLKRGRCDTVLRFLGEWKRIWRGDRSGKLDTWAAAIRAHELPDFGANLLL